MSYPQRLIPTVQDLLIEEPNREELLIRRVSNELELRDSTGNLSAIAIEEHQLTKGYSVNKLPPSFEKDVYIKFFDQKKFYEPWEVGTPGYIPIQDEFDYHEEPQQHFMLRIGDIHGFKTNYPFPANSEENNYTIHIIVEHAPQISNISHFALICYCYDSDGKLADFPNNKRTKKLIKSAFKEHIIKFARFSQEEFFECQ